MAGCMMEIIGTILTLSKPCWQNLRGKMMARRKKADTEKRAFAFIFILLIFKCSTIVQVQCLHQIDQGLTTGTAIRYSIRVTHCAGREGIVANCCGLRCTRMIRGDLSEQINLFQWCIICVWWKLFFEATESIPIVSAS